MTFYTKTLEPLLFENEIYSIHNLKINYIDDVNSIIIKDYFDLKIDEKVFKIISKLRDDFLKQLEILCLFDKSNKIDIKYLDELCGFNIYVIDDLSYLCCDFVKTSAENKKIKYLIELNVKRIEYYNNIIKNNSEFLLF